jgi:hypothetical protein
MLAHDAPQFADMFDDERRLARWLLCVAVAKPQPFPLPSWPKLWQAFGIDKAHTSCALHRLQMRGHLSYSETDNGGFLVHVYPSHLRLVRGGQ